MSTVCQYLALYRLLVLYHNVHCCLLQSVHCVSVTNAVYILYSVSLSPLSSSTVCHFLSVPQALLSVGSVLLCPLLSSNDCTRSANT